MADRPKPLRYLSPAEAISAGLSGRRSLSGRKYSLGLLQEALKLSEQVGLKEAERISGVNTAAIRTYRQVKCGPRQVRKRKSTPEQNQRCLELAQKLFRSGFSRGMRKCWVEAGRLMGINGKTVENRYVAGIWP